MHAIPRRAALQLALAYWAKAQEHAHPPTATSAAAYRFQFFQPKEISTVRRFAAVLIPATPRSGGAAAARVEEFMDSVLAAAAPSLQRLWRRGLAEWSKQKDANAVLALLAPQEFSPRSVQDNFFVLFKSAATTAFYTSEEGITKELGYQGMAFLREFPGWQGEAFQTPPDYKPLLKTRS
jgi:hypothetical protein